MASEHAPQHLRWRLTLLVGALVACVGAACVLWLLWHVERSAAQAGVQEWRAIATSVAESQARQFGRAVRGQVGRDDDRVQRKARPRGADAAQLFTDDEVEQQVGAGAAQAFGQPAAQQAVVTRLLPHAARHAVGLFPGGVVRRDLALAKAAHLVAEGVVVGGEEGAWGGFHGCHCSKVQAGGHFNKRSCLRM